MAELKLNLGEKTTVRRQAALYKIEQDSPDRLVLRAKKIGAIVGGIFLTVFGLILGWGAYALIDKRTYGGAVVAGVIGLLFLAGGVALLRSGIRNRDRIVFDRSTGEVRFEMTKEKDRHTIPFSDIEKFKLRFEDKSFSSKDIQVVFKFVIMTKSGDEIKVDEAFKADEMKALAAKASQLCGVPFDESAG